MAACFLKSMTDDWMAEVKGRVPHRPKRRWWAVAARPQTGGNLLLDLMATSTIAAFSFRKLRSSYSGWAIQVRRSSDSTVQNIGFAGNDFDVGSYNAFVGVATGTMVIWYDQSGNSNNLSATTGPVINLTAANGLPTTIFPSGSDLSNSSPTAVQPYSFGAVAMRTANFSAFGGFIGDTANEGIYFNTTPSQVTLYAGAVQGTMPATDSVLHAIAAVFNGGTSSIIVDGASTVPGSFNPGANNYSGARLGNLGGGGLTGDVSEGLFWNSALPATDITTLMANQKAYWHTP